MKEIGMFFLGIGIGYLNTGNIIGFCICIIISLIFIIPNNSSIKEKTKHLNNPKNLIEDK